MKTKLLLRITSLDLYTVVRTCISSWDVSFRDKLVAAPQEDFLMWWVVTHTTGKLMPWLTPTWLEKEQRVNANPNCTIANGLSWPSTAYLRAFYGIFQQGHLSLGDRLLCKSFTYPRDYIYPSKQRALVRLGGNFEFIF